MGRPTLNGVGLCYDSGMFRTRDFILLFSAIMFLVVAIGTTLINQSRSNSGVDILALQPESTGEYIATVARADEISRSERIAQMRSKISQQNLISEDLPEENLTEETVDASTSTDQLGSRTGATICPQYRPYTNFWDARDLNLVESAYSRSLTRGEVSSTSVPELVLQLPVRAQQSGNPTCIASDVIGIANDGSLIRNDEMGLYSIFGSETLLGYALDGFPIYGAGTSPSDACGGVATAAGYRYQLSTERNTIINCFAAAPVLLP